ncbi:MAG: hypothetical protein MPK62_10070 [Alphaproteobacteria bacterium]|nr:hypothetical protein [Alphaproteobacteria bacterium]MDA8031447.1 hypothetical protein [Alphaproteobacteria bacterium]
MPASHVAVQMVLSSGERAATHPAVTILIVCALAVAVHFLFRGLNA